MNISNSTGAADWRCSLLLWIALFADPARDQLARGKLRQLHDDTLSNGLRNRAAGGAAMISDAQFTINIGTTPLKPRDLPNDVTCQVLATKYTKGNEPIDGTLPLAAALLEPWLADLHFTQYVCDSAVRAIKNDVNNYKLQFGFCRVRSGLRQPRPAADARQLLRGWSGFCRFSTIRPTSPTRRAVVLG